MFPFFTAWRDKKLWNIYPNLAHVVSIAGALLAVGFVVTGFYQLAAILAGVNLIVTRYALGAVRKPEPCRLDPRR
jgi:hypothetical protein